MSVVQQVLLRQLSAVRQMHSVLRQSALLRLTLYALHVNRCVRLQECVLLPVQLQEPVCLLLKEIRLFHQQAVHFLRHLDCLLFLQKFRRPRPLPSGVNS